MNGPKTRFRRKFGLRSLLLAVAAIGISMAVAAPYVRLLFPHTPLFVVTWNDADACVVIDGQRYEEKMVYLPIEFVASEDLRTLSVAERSEKLHSSRTNRYVRIQYDRDPQHELRFVVRSLRARTFDPQTLATNSLEIQLASVRTPSNGDVHLHVVLKADPSPTPKGIALENIPTIK